MRDFADLVDEAAAVDVSGWDFGWLDGRATEERPPWGYSRMVAARLPRAASALDIDTCVWWVPDFSVDRYRDTLKQLDDQIRGDGAFVAHSTRYLIEARRNARGVTAE